MGLSWCLAQLLKPCCERQHEAAARDAAAGQAGLSARPGSSLPASTLTAPCPPSAQQQESQTSSFQWGKRRSCPPFICSYWCPCPGVGLFPRSRRLRSPQQRARLFTRAFMSVNERVGVDDAPQSMNCLQRKMAHSHSFRLCGDRGMWHGLRGPFLGTPEGTGRRSRWVHTVGQGLFCARD